MSSRIGFGQIDRYSTLGELADRVRRALRRIVGPLGALLVAETGYLGFSHSPGTVAFAMIAFGAWITLAAWSRSGKGVPLLPIAALQTLAIYGLPVVFGHDIVHQYSAEYLQQAGLEVLVFSLATLGAWTIGLATFAPGQAVSYTLPDLQHEGIRRTQVLGFGLIVASTLYGTLDTAGLVDFLINMLPAGSSSIVTALTGTCNACGLFLVAISYGSGELSQQGKLAFWALFTWGCITTSASFLLSAVALEVMAVAIGLFWGSGRVPWKYLIFVCTVLSFFNAGKFVMRGRYWELPDDEAPAPTTLAQMPSRYAEWFQASYESLLSPQDLDPDVASGAKPKEKHEGGMFDRIDNLQNELYVIDAVDARGIHVLGGASYAVIPALLIPRILWPDKPRTHEGQVMLNVHFGRQDLNSTLKTYVAWGLLPEAYGNFGPIVGSLALGAVLGFWFAWLEMFTARKLLISLEGFLAFDLLLTFTNSYEMVASVFVTSTFQSVVLTVGACMFFVRRRRMDRPDDEPEEADEPGAAPAP